MKTPLYIAISVVVLATLNTTSQATASVEGDYRFEIKRRINAGGPHTDKENPPVIRKWRISTGKSEEWKGLKDGSIFSLAFDPTGELVAAGTMTGHLAVWNSNSGTILTKRSFGSCIRGLTINKQEIYLTKIRIEEQLTEACYLTAG